MSLPPGTAGTRATLNYMRGMVRRYKKAVPIRQLAFAIIDNVRGHKNFSAQVRAIHAWVTSNIQYVKDITGVETLATPVKTLEFGKGDCDDQSVYYARLLHRGLTRLLCPRGKYPLQFRDSLIEVFFLVLREVAPRFFVKHHQ